MSSARLGRLLRNVRASADEALKLFREDAGPEPVAKALLACQADLDAAFAELGIADEDASPPCSHPLSRCKTAPGSSMGSLRYLCGLCGKTVTPEEVDLDG